MNTTKVSTSEIKSNPNRFVFSTIPMWAKSATVDYRGDVKAWHRKGIVSLAGYSEQTTARALDKILDAIQ